MESSQATVVTVNYPKKKVNPLPSFNQQVVRDDILPAICMLEKPCTGFVLETKLPVDGMLIGVAMEFLGLSNPTIEEFKKKLEEFLCVKNIAA